MVFSMNVKLGDLLSNPEASAVVEKHWPGVCSNPIVSLIHNYSLKEIASFPQTNLPEDKLMAITADLAKIVV